MTTTSRGIAGYRIDALIGKGGMAEVYRAVALEGPRMGRQVALKRLLPSLARDPGYVALFEQEAEVTRRLRHPNIVEVLDTGVAGGTPFIVMDYVDGKNLRQVLAQCAARSILLPMDFAAYVAHVLAEALSHAHAGKDAAGRPLGIVHCDVSPSNVFISRLGEIKLGDFGVALTPGAAPGSAGAGARDPKRAAEPPSASGPPGGRDPKQAAEPPSVSGPPGGFGKVHYLAPEQLRGERPTPQTDLFALGAVFFELLTNAFAFPGDDVNEVGQRILASKLRAPSELRPEVPFDLDVMVLRCLSADPRDRYPSAAAFAEEIATRYDPAIGTPLAIAAVVRGLFGATAT